MFNQFKKTALVAAAGLAFVATPAFAADGNPATATGTGKVRILEALSIDATAGTLDFGLMVKGAPIQTAGATSFSDFTIDANGTVGTCPTDWTCSGTQSEATFTVTGTAGANVQLSLTNANVDLDGNLAEDYLDVVLDLSDSTVLLDVATGQATFSVGGTLTVRGDVPTGSYDEPFEVQAEYL